MEASHPIMLMMMMMPLVSHLLSPFSHFLTDMGRVPGPVSRMGGENERGRAGKVCDTQAACSLFGTRSTT